MKKKEFLDELRKRLSRLDDEEIEKSISFYNEVILDAIDSGKTEEEAVNELGTPKEVADKILTDAPIKALIKGSVKKAKQNNNVNGWTIAFLILGFPLWFPLLITFGALLFTFYLVFWIIIFSALIVVGSIGLGGLGAVLFGIIQLIANGFAIGGSFIGAGLVLIALSIFLLYPSIALCKVTFKGGIGLLKAIKRSIFRKKVNENE